MQIAQGDALDFPSAGEIWGGRVLLFAESLTSASATLGSPRVINFYTQKKQEEMGVLALILITGLRQHAGSSYLSTCS